MFSEAVEESSEAFELAVAFLESAEVFSEAFGSSEAIGFLEAEATGFSEGFEASGLAKAAGFLKIVEEFPETFSFAVGLSEAVDEFSEADELTEEITDRLSATFEKISLWRSLLL